MSQPVTLKDVYDIVLRLEDKMGARMDKVDARADGHDARLRSVERWRAWSAGVGAVVLFLIGVVIRT